VSQLLTRDPTGNKCSSSSLPPSFFLTLVLIIIVNKMRLIVYNKYTARW